MDRQSTLFLPTERQPPADAEAISHKLMVRAGLIRQIGAGLWAMLPLGWRVHMRIEQIIREEINAIGGQEMRAPTLTPAELWETTGRIDVPNALAAILLIPVPVQLLGRRAKLDDQFAGQVLRFDFAALFVSDARLAAKLGPETASNNPAAIATT